MAKKSPVREAGKFIDWTEPEMIYISTNLTLADVAEMFDIAPGTVGNYSKDHEWVRLRREYREKVEQETLATLRSEGVMRLSKLARDVNILADQVDNALADHDQLYRRVVQERLADGSTDTHEIRVDKIDHAALQGLSKSLNIIMGMVRSLYSIQDPDKAESARLARERLEIEKQRAAAAGVGAEQDEQAGVILIPEAGNDAVDAGSDAVDAD